MRNAALLAYLLGLALAVVIIAWQGVDVVAEAIGRAGLRLLWLPPWFLVSIVLAALAWAMLFPSNTRPDARRLLLATWIGMSINWLLPVAQIGGDIARGAWLARRAKPGAMMVATALADKVLQTAVQAMVAVIGVVLLVALSNDTRLAPSALGFAAFILAVVAAFLVLQRRGLLAGMISLADRVYRRSADARGESAAGYAGRLLDGATSVDAGIRDSLRSLPRVAAYCMLRLPSRLLMAGEVWLVLFVVGHPVSVAEALMIECLTQTARSAAFAVPGAYGIQEGAFVLIGPLVGVPADIALLVSLAKRMRELTIGLPGLCYLQVSEGALAHRPG